MNDVTALRKINTLCVFCGSSEGNDPAYLQSAEQFGSAMVNSGMDLVYGGGGKGIMGRLAATVKAGSRRVTGIIPTRIHEMVKHIEHDEDELIIVGDMHERKAAMYARADAFVALPGGIGTLEEVMEALTWLQLGYHDKPVGLLDTAGFFSHLTAFLSHMIDEGFLRSVLFDTLTVDSDPMRLIERLQRVPLDLPAKIAHP
ncbi:MAG: TIGR00730 family Rossman fold protein [Sphaerochaetaceae bacterium]|nr:TIGR00730 family Rossman fold protein [Sphaerochaetaceae bacterium]